MTVKDLGDLLIYLGAVSAALSAIAAVAWWLFVRPFTRWLREQITATGEQVTQTGEQVTSTQGTAEAVHAEVTPNHGSSLKDAVDRTEVKVDQLSRRLTDHVTNHPGAGS